MTTPCPAEVPGRCVGGDRLSLIGVNRGVLLDRMSFEGQPPNHGVELFKLKTNSD